MFKVWLDASLAVIFVAYAVAFFTGAAVPDGVMAGLMASGLFASFAQESAVSYITRKRDERKGVWPCALHL